MRFIQREGTVGNVTFNGDAARVLKGNEVVADWTTGGVVSSIPQGSGYTLEVRSGDTITSESIVIGIVVDALGQSNMVDWTRENTTLPSQPDTYFLQADGTWGPVVGAGAIAFTSDLSQALGVPVAFIQSAVGGSALREGVDGSSSSYWLNPAPGSIYNQAVSQLASVGGKAEFVLWAQGETDANQPDGYADALDTLFGRVEADFGSPQIYLQEIGPHGGRDLFAGIRAQEDLEADRSDYVDIGATTSDLDLQDSVHLNAVSIAQAGHRMAESVLEGLGVEAKPTVTVGMADQHTVALPDVYNEYYANPDGDTVNGGADRDVIHGGAGGDMLLGNDGNDALFGMMGADTAYGGNGFDALSGGAGSDRLFGNDGNDILQGDADNDDLDGGAGNDILDGGTGADTMAGGTGNDVYIVDQASDTVQESVGGGYDTIYLKSSFRLAAGSEVEWLQTAVKYTSSVTVTGNEFANTIVTERGNDVIDGGGGDDVLMGGAGNDTYYVDSSADQVIERSRAGTDTVNTTCDYTLGTGSEVEILKVNPITTTGLKLKGNSYVNQIYGGVGNDTLEGGGGADLLYGGAGDDTYVITAAGVQVIENFGEGIDTVLSSVTIALGANVENLTLTGTAAIGATGNELTNTLIGNGSRNDLNGGAGADLLVGGGGDDSYHVDDRGDIVVELAGGGADTVYTSINFTLGDQVEVLRVEPTVSAGLSLTGNSLSNKLYGGAGGDTLTGVGSNDLLYGGAGDDAYHVGAGDRVYESIAGGFDSVYTTASYTLLAGQEIEVLDASLAPTGVSLTGNEFANQILGGAGSDVLKGVGGNDLLSGAGGDDRYYVNTGDQVIEARGGGTDTIYTGSDFAVAPDQEIESLRANAGALGLNLGGNAFTTRIYGGAGNDTITAAAANALLYGGAGDDTYYVHGAGRVYESLNGGSDTVYADTNFTLAAGQEIETLRANAGSTGLVLTGNEFANSIFGGAGADILKAVGGNDVLSGGSGGDTYYVTASDRVIEAPGGGNDTIYTAADYTVAADQEIETLRANAGSTGVSLTGNNWTTRIYGGAGSDILTAAGAATLLYGGAGNDIYYVGGADRVFETVNGGFDTVYAASSFTLGAGQEIEVLRSAGSSGVSLTGNEFANSIYGGVGADVLNGAGGADLLVGGSGDDRYYVDNTADVVQEASDSGTDTVYASTDWTIAAAQSIETLRANAGSTGLRLTGNELAQTIMGGVGNDTLVGGGGADSLVGGQGDDTYVVADPSVRIRENAGEGTDTVQSSVTYTLQARSNVENLTLTGNDATNGSGNEAGNVLIGNSAANLLSGAAGADTLIGNGGGDTLTGGTGADTFVFTATSDSPANAGFTQITDFSQADGDKIDLSAILTGASDQHFHFNGTGSGFSNQAGELIYTSLGSTTFLQGDVDGNGVADLQIGLKGLITLQPSDLRL